jgi:hypothetical protein
MITLPCPICFQDASFSSDGTGKCHYCGTNWFIDEKDMGWEPLKQPPGEAGNRDPVGYGGARKKSRPGANSRKSLGGDF